jgi:hypothetical protein
MNETSLAPIIRKMWQSGHIDTLHSWGNFDQGGFTRSRAEKGLNELQKYHATIPVWVNHGIGLNHQKLGSCPQMFGDEPASDNYHLDLTSRAGCEYYWTGKSTHVIGQNAKPTISVQSKLMIQWMMKRTRYSGVVDPIYDDGNQLVSPIEFRDGHKAWEFVRFINSWGREQVLDIHDLKSQLSKGIVDQLIKNNGFMILYTHFNENVDIGGLPEGLKENLKYLKRKVDNKEIFLATSSRLLKYKEICDNVSFNVKHANDEIQIFISDKLKSLIGTKNIRSNQLGGLTFYTNQPSKTSVWFNHAKLKTITNPQDETGNQSIKIPWEKLSYPC